MSRYYIAISLIVMVFSFATQSSTFAVRSAPAPGFFDFPNAIGCRDGGFLGSEARIETANPFVEVIPILSFSTVRTFVQNFDSNHNWFGEVGWFKGDMNGYSVTAFTSICKAGIFCPALVFYSPVTTGSMHTYRVSYNPNTGTYRFYVDGVRVRTTNLGFVYTTRVCAGGETSHTANNMGPSDVLDNMFKNANLIWKPYKFHYNLCYNNCLGPYIIADIDGNNWYVYTGI